MEENLTINYMALLACIISPKTMNVESALKSVALYDIKEKIQKNNNKPIIMIDTFKNERLEFRTQYEVAEIIGCSHNTVSIYRRSGKKYKDRYLFIDKNE